MKYLPLLLVASLASGASFIDEIKENTKVEVLLLGTSYHSNKEADWNKNNWGIGVGIAHQLSEYTDFVANVGTYKDSMYEQANFAVFGFRGYIFDRHGFHGTLGMSGGYMSGSGYTGLTVFPVASIGYDRYELCGMVSPARYEKINYDTGKVTANMGYVASLFLKIQLF
jgi:hypothetical protein